MTAQPTAQQPSTQNLRRHRERQQQARERLAEILRDLAAQEDELSSRNRILEALLGAQARAHSDNFEESNMDLFKSGSTNRFREAVAALDQRVQDQRQAVDEQRGAFEQLERQADAARFALVTASRTLDSVIRHQGTGRGSRPGTGAGRGSKAGVGSRTGSYAAASGSRAGKARPR
ncbi:MAG: hypothetical protein AAF772_07685 [Acidobacteriota bacterium]